jgi:hypothetical protein
LLGDDGFDAGFFEPIIEGFTAGVCGDGFTNGRSKGVITSTKAGASVKQVGLVP